MENKIRQLQKKRNELLTHPFARVMQNASDDVVRCSLSAHAGQTAFFIILSFLPFMVFLFAILRLFPRTEGVFVTYLIDLIPDSFAELVESMIHDIYKNSNLPIMSVSIVCAVWLSSKFFVSLIQGLNAVYRQVETRNYIKRRLLSCLYSIVFAIFLIFVLAFLVFGHHIHALIIRTFPTIDSIVERIVNFRMLIGAFFLFAAFLLIYHFLPNCKWKLYYHLPGAALTTFGWLVFSALYSVYVTNYTHYSTFYGTMATIALLMLWLYVCMYILFLGGYVNSVIYFRQKERRAKKELIQGTTDSSSSTVSESAK